jgi:hypothetical protein
MQNGVDCGSRDRHAVCRVEPACSTASRRTGCVTNQWNAETPENNETTWVVGPKTEIGSVVHLLQRRSTVSRACHRRQKAEYYSDKRSARQRGGWSNNSSLIPRTKASLQQRSIVDSWAQTRQSKASWNCRIILVPQFQKDMHFEPPTRSTPLLTRPNEKMSLWLTL